MSSSYPLNTAHYGKKCRHNNDPGAAYVAAIAARSMVLTGNLCLTIVIEISVSEEIN